MINKIYLGIEGYELDGDSDLWDLGKGFLLAAISRIYDGMRFNLRLFSRLSEDVTLKLVTTNGFFINMPVCMSLSNGLFYRCKSRFEYT